MTNESVRFLGSKNLQDGNTQRRLKMIERYYEQNPKAIQEEAITFIPETSYMVELHAKMR